jgi:hypothetical protein
VEDGVREQKERGAKQPELDLQQAEGLGKIGRLRTRGSRRQAEATLRTPTPNMYLPSGMHLHLVVVAPQFLLAPPLSRFAAF